ncbi:hypothetical protein BpHYR1_006776 [Brachionus plicatilis]|uniref:Uncharacterized protein n=1 Tax=Brachionus plicatilis TaxID=10195 RepID=A0A3M7SYM7_BRAPC|nr:hypothetical protein BpHYR1_006776 [Brachionus plicatilis]
MFLLVDMFLFLHLKNKNKSKQLKDQLRNLPRLDTLVFINLNHTLSNLKYFEKNKTFFSSIISSKNTQKRIRAISKNFRIISIRERERIKRNNYYYHNCRAFVTETGKIAKQIVVPFS